MEKLNCRFHSQLTSYEDISPLFYQIYLVKTVFRICLLIFNQHCNRWTWYKEQDCHLSHSNSPLTQHVLLLNTTNLNSQNKLMNRNSRKPVKPEDLLRNLSFIQIIFGSLQECDYNTVITPSQLWGGSGCTSVIAYHHLRSSSRSSSVAPHL